MLSFGFKRAKILSYDKESRTAQVHIHGLTDGFEGGLTATFAYAVGEDDRDTEIKILGNSNQLPDVFVFFEGGEHDAPIIAFFSSHGSDNAQDIRRIKQENIEILAKQHIQIESETLIIKANTRFIGATVFDGAVNFNQLVTFNSDVKQGSKGRFNINQLTLNGVDVNNHYHVGDSGGLTGIMQSKTG